MGEGGLFKLQFTGNRGVTEALSLARGPGKGDLILRKTIDAKDVGDIKGVKLIRDDLVRDLNVWVWCVPPPPAASLFRLHGYLDGIGITRVYTLVGIEFEGPGL